MKMLSDSAVTKDDLAQINGALTEEVDKLRTWVYTLAGANAVFTIIIFFVTR